MSENIALRSYDGRNVKVEVLGVSLTVEQAHDLAYQIGRHASYAENAYDRHERHLDLRASCPICVYEARFNPDALRDDRRDD